MNHVLIAALAALALAACKDEVAERPLPVALTAQSVGHYCQMNLLEHPGPKAQVHLQGLPDPLFFSQVRDAIAYQRMPEQSHAITAVYVNDMGAAPSWDDPGAENWAAAEDVVFVVGALIVAIIVQVLLQVLVEEVVHPKEQFVKHSTCPSWGNMGDGFTNFQGDIIAVTEATRRRPASSGRSRRRSAP